MITKRLIRWRACPLALAVLLALGASCAFAQGNAPQQPQQSPQSVNHDQAIYLVRSALLTLNDANRSGNYTVLRDLAAPDFQARNSAADLAQSFADLRRRNFDLFAAALIPPQFAEAPALDGNGRVRLKGFFPTRPLQISFDFTFQAVGGQWRLLAISVATPEAAREQPQVNRPMVQNSPKLFYGFRLFDAAAGLRW
jgi:hypothetical protein